MEAGIVGLPNIGKSTLFNALTGARQEAGNFPFATTEPHAATVHVPDPRLAQIARHIETKKIIPATLQLVDMPALVRGASEGEGMGNKFLAEIRNVDALVHVVRCFDDSDVPHVDDSADPMRDIETIDLELIAADAQIVANAMDKAEKLARFSDKEAVLRLEALRKCHAALEELQPVRSAGLTEEESFAVRSFAFLTEKPVLYVANVGEGEVGEGADPMQSDLVKKIAAHAAEQGGQIVAVCAKLEAELSELEPDDRAEMLGSLGLSEPALDTVARAIYRLLSLQSFFTAGPKEIRAWPVAIGATAPQAAGVIHSDFERGFIRVEIYHVDELTELKSEHAIKEAGKLRKEGKHYVMQDGDVCHFLFNV